MIQMVHNIEEANCITHSGTMHADEVFATAFLHLYKKNIKVYRTNSIKKDDNQQDYIIYDIGRGKYDHHQLDSAKRENQIPYSSIGLLWKDFGKDYLEKNDFPEIEEIYLAVDKDLIEGIDADDNGVFPKIESTFKVKTIPSIIKMFNPSFESTENESDQFLKAVKLAEMILKEELSYIKGKILAEKKVLEYLNKYDGTSNYFILDEYLPYEETLLKDEKYNKIEFVAFPSNRGGFAIKTVPISFQDHNPRKAFPESWAGLENEELEKISNIKGLRFCHSGRFIVNCKDYNVVLKVIEMCQ